METFKAIIDEWPWAFILSIHEHPAATIAITAFRRQARLHSWDSKPMLASSRAEQNQLMEENRFLRGSIFKVLPPYVTAYAAAGVEPIPCRGGATSIVAWWPIGRLRSWLANYLRFFVILYNIYVHLYWTQLYSGCIFYILYFIYLSFQFLNFTYFNIQNYLSEVNFFF